MGSHMCCSRANPYSYQKDLERIMKELIRNRRSVLYCHTSIVGCTF